MLTLTYEADNGRSVVFGLPPHDLVITGLGGIHGLGADIHVFSQYLQHGTTKVSSQLRSRRVTIQFRIVRNVIANRLHLLETMNALTDGTLTLMRGDFVRKIRCTVEQAPDSTMKNGYTMTAVLSCPNPFWESTEESRKDIASWEGGIKWDRVYPSAGFTYGKRTPSRVVNVFNPGTSDVGMRIVFAALGTVVNPSITNVETFETIKLKVSMSAGDKIEVNTNTGQKQATLTKANGATTNAYSYWDYTNTFLQLKEGDSLFRFDADSGEGALDVSLYFNPQFLGV